MKNNQTQHKEPFGARIRNRFAKIFGYFKGFNTLVAMQLKDRLNVSFRAHKKESLTKMILFALLLGGLVAIIFVIFYLLNFLGVLGVGGFVPVSMFNVLFYLIITMNILSCISRLTNALFFSEDNQVLLTYPVRSNTIFLSKLVVFYILEIIKSFTIIVPLFVAYGISYGFPIYYYPWLILCFLVLALLPVAIASLVCIPYMFIKSFFKKFQYIQGFAVLIALVVLTVLVFRVVNLLPEDLKLALMWSNKYFPMITDFTKKVETIFKPFVYLSKMLIGYGVNSTNNPRNLIIASGPSVGILFIVIAICLVLFGLSYLLAKPLFFSMASKPFEYKKVYISHNFKIARKNNTNLFEQAIVPIHDHELNSHEKEEEVKRLDLFLRMLNREEKLFLRGKIDIKRIVRFLRKYTNTKRGQKDPFELISIEEFIKRGEAGYIIQTRYTIPSLVLVKRCSKNSMYCYDPNYLAKKNYKKNGFLSTLFKDILMDFRTPGCLWNNYLLFIVTPLAVLVLNSVFAAMKQSSSGQLYTIFFNSLIIGMILCATNLSMASIYSREGNASYLLKASPMNYMKALSSKLIIRMVIVIGSLAFTMVIYSQKCSLNYVRFDLLFFTFLFIYLGHLLWAAELDYMNPQDRLYAEVGQQQGNISNPNETVTSVLVFLISILFSAMVYFFVNENIIKGFIKLFFIALGFFLARVGLFIAKIYAHGTSRSERGRD